MMSKPVGLLYTGNSLELLKELDDESIQTCVTSPPYWGLRDYAICQCRQGRVQHDSSTLAGSQAGTPSHFGKADPDCDKCRGSGRVEGLQQIWGGDTNCEHQWLETSRKQQSGGTGELSAKQITNRGTTYAQNAVESGECLFCNAWYGSLGNEPTPELFIEHLVMVFREVFRVLRDDGTLWLNIGDSYFGGGRGGNPADSTFRKQSTNVGSLVKPTKVPDGCKSKDLVGIPWMLAFALRANGFYLRQDIIYSKGNPMPESVKDRFTKSHEYIFLLTKSRDYYFDADAVKEDAVCGGKKVKLGVKSFSKGQANAIGIEPSGNGAKPEFEVGLKRNKRSVWHMNSKPFKDAHFATFSEELVTTPIMAGSKPGDTVLDPFSGAATTGKVALSLGRNYIGLEQNGFYNEMARKRLLDAGLDVEVID